jgi:hypothetical protein
LGLVTVLAHGAPEYVPTQASFDAVKTRIYAEPLSVLPHYGGLGAADTAAILIGSLKTALGIRAKATIADESDFKERTPKILHPMGVCASANWTITAASAATGLLSKGTHVNAIVRMSTGSDQIKWEPGKTRQFGLAVKLFPTQEPGTAVVTRNVFTLDQTGLNGDSRASYLSGDGPEDEVFFRNNAEGTGFAIEKLNALFAKVDIHPGHRPLYPLTEVTQNGAMVAVPVTPWEIRFVPHVTSKIEAFDVDFRTELAAAQPGQIYFDIVIPKQQGFAATQTIGKLVVGQPVVSVACDQELHFHHHPNTRTSSPTDMAAAKSVSQ